MSEIITPGTPEYDYAVYDCSPKKDDRQWRIGDYALRLFPMKNVGRQTKEEEENEGKWGENLRTFAKDIEVEYETVSNYRKVASAWKIGDRSPNSSWTIHHVLQGFPYLMRDGLTKTEAQKLVKTEKIRLEAEEAMRAEAERIRAEEEAKRQAEETAQAEEKRKADEVEAQRKEAEAKEMLEKFANKDNKVMPTDDNLFSIVKVNMAGAVNRLDVANVRWGEIKEHTPQMVDWVSKRIDELIESLSMAKSSLQQFDDADIHNFMDGM